MKKNNKKRNIIAGISIFTILVLFAFILPSMQTSLLPIPVVYDVITEDHIVTFHTESEYYVKYGCKASSDCSNKNACDVDATIVGYDETCPISTCELTGWQGCGGTTTQQKRCMWEGSCSSSDSYCKSLGCYWGTVQSGGTVGGTLYKRIEQCSWWIEVKNLDGTLIKEYSAKTSNEKWTEKPYYTEQINDKIDGLQLSFVDLRQGVECEQQKWEIRDGDYKYDVCIGNNAGAGNDCINKLQTTCTLSCGDTEILDSNNCICKPAPVDTTNPPVDTGTGDTGNTDTGDTGDKDTYVPDTSMIFGIVILLIGLITFAVIRIKGKKRR